MGPTVANVIDHLTGLFGSQTRLAEAAGCSQPTISEKRKSNTLTMAQMRRILATAPNMGVPVRPDDFFPEFAQSAAT
jgi:transcriptional regulator with XRE-family HTH domain